MLRGLIYAIISACSFGFLPILGKIAYAHGMGTFEILQYRFLFGALILGAFYAVTRPQLLRIRPRSLAKAALLGLIPYPIESACFMGSVKYIPASTTSLILYFYPVTVTLLAAFFLKERVSRRQASSLALVVAGCAIVFCDAFMKQADIRGILLAVTSMFLFSMYLVAVQCFLRDENPLTITFYVISFASVAFCAVAGGPATLLNYGRDGVLIALALGLVPTVLAVTLLYMAIGTIGSSYTSVFSTLEPVTTVIASWIILGDPIAPWQVAGGLLIIIGIVWPNIDLLRQGHGATHPA